MVAYQYPLKGILGSGAGGWGRDSGGFGVPRAWAGHGFGMSSSVLLLNEFLVALVQSRFQEVRFEHHLGFGMLISRIIYSLEFRALRNETCFSSLRKPNLALNHRHATSDLISNYVWQLRVDLLVVSCSI